MKKRPPDLTAAAGRPFDPQLGQRDVLRWLSAAPAALLIVGTWLLLHPYRGFVHDARLYAAQALRELSPEIFGSDLFFAFGSQDQFTLFTKLYAPLVHAVGLPAASLAVVVLGHAVWLTGALALALRLTGGGRAAFAGLLLLAALPSSYGGWQTFGFAEGFATPRLPAEALGLWALWALTHRRLILAGVFAVLAGLLHPIMCATVLLVGLLFLAWRDWRWGAAAAAGGFAVIAAAYAGLPPVDRLFATMDPEWRSVVEQRNAYLFPSLWRASDWSRFALTMAMTLAAATTLQGWRRALMLSAAVAGLIGVGLTSLGGDLLGSVLLIQLQLYRTMWLLGVFAYLGAGFLLVRLWALPEDGRAIVALLAFGTFVTLTVAPVIGAVLVTGGLGFALLRLHGRARPLPAGARPLPVVLAALLGLGVLVHRIISTFDKAEALATIEGASAHILTTVSVVEVTVIAVGVMLLAGWRPAAAARALPAAALVVLIASLLAWDRRDAWPHAVLVQPATAPAWTLPTATQVFWENDVVGPWLILRQPSYVSVAQGAGIAFVRDTALAFQQRIALVQPLMQIEMLDIYRRQAAAHGALQALDRAALTRACAGDTALGAMVLSRAVEGAYTAVWDPPAPFYDTWMAQRGIAQVPVRRYYLYRCDELRGAAAQAAAAG